MEQQIEDFLAHYGVPGMHWGQRKSYSNPLSSVRRNDKVSKYESVIKKSNGNPVKANIMIGSKFLAKYGAIKLTEFAVNKAVSGVSYYNQKSMRGLAFKMNPRAAGYVKNVLFAMKVGNVINYLSDASIVGNAELNYKKEQQRNKAKEGM